MELHAAQAPALPASRAGGSRLRMMAVIAIAAIAILGAAYVVDQPVGTPGAGSGGTGQAAGAGGGPPLVGTVPPNLSVTALDGTTVSLAALRGKVVWVTFGASWCADCRAEAADLQATYAAHHAQGLEVVAMFNKDASSAAAYAKKAGFTFIQVADPTGAIGDQFHVLGFPTHVFIGRDGIVRAVRFGRLTGGDMEQLVSGLLGS